MAARGPKSTAASRIGNREIETLRAPETSILSPLSQGSCDTERSDSPGINEC